MDKSLETQKGIHIWKLIKLIRNIIQSKLTWILGNEKMINIWKYGIMGNLPIGQNLAFIEIIRRMEDRGTFTLYDLSVWSKYGGGWQGWSNF